ncbi:MAG: sulfatase-like hydrolase/transferase [Akkermansiaceae bacterium]
MKALFILPLLAGLASAISLPATSFPDDGSTATFTSSDSLLTFTTTNFFNTQGDFVGDGGGTGNLVNAYDGDETLSIQTTPGTVLTSLAFRWTNSTIIISGWAVDPQASLSNGGSVTWDDSEKTLTVIVPWDAGNGNTLTFAESAASEDTTLLFTFAGAQATFTTFDYEVINVEAPTPLVHLSFDDETVTGTTVNDLSPSDNHGSIVASATAPTTGQPGLFNQAFTFRADDDPDGIVTLPNGVIPSGNSARTISLWFEQIGGTLQNKLLGYGGTSAGTAFDVGLEAGGIRIRHFGGNLTFGSDFDFLNADAGWHHLAIRVPDAATTFADVNVFLDGQLIPLIPGGADSVTLNTTASTFGIGSSSIAASAIGFDGLIDEFKAWDSALTNGQIINLAKAPPVPTILSFTSTPQNRGPAGTDITLSWNVENTESLTLNPGNIDVTGMTSLTVTPTAKTTYTLTATSTTTALTGTASTSIAIGEDPYPNIIVFFLDDFGWSDWEQNGAPTGSNFYETPNMNRLASQGLYFPNGYASTPVCSPTRGALMTGQAPAFNKLTDWITGSGDNGQPVREAEWVKRLPTTIPSFPRVFADCGYRSIHVGKWHLGSGTEPEANPLNHGFQVNIGGNQFGTPPGPERYFASANGFSALPNMGPAIAPQGSYLTDVLTEQAVAQIQSAASDNAAFSMFFSHYAVHTPIQAPAATVAKYQAKLDNNPGMDWRGQDNPTYAAMIEHVDQSLGNIMDTLADPDGDPNTDDSIAENTLIIFTADNGGLLSATSNRPLRDGKGGNYDGGVREPWVFWMPGTITPGIEEEVVVTHDVFPTILSMAGIPNPTGHEVNGQDLSPLLKGESFTREKPVTFHYPHWSPQGGSPYSAIRRGDWKAIYLYETKSWELYNLKDDPGESNNLVTAENDRLGLLTWLLAQDLETLDANYPRNVGTLAEEPPLPLLTPENDSDNDGQNDLEEAIQGTDRNDPADTFKPNGTIDDGAFNMSFPAKPGRLYYLEASETLLAGDWAPIQEHLPSTNPSTVTFSDEASLMQRFYRISVQLP